MITRNFNILHDDARLREAVRKSDLKLPSLPTDLNERLLQSIQASAEGIETRTRRTLWISSIVAATAAAGIALALTLRPMADDGDSIPLEMPVISTTKPSHVASLQTERQQPDAPSATPLLTKADKPAEGVTHTPSAISRKPQKTIAQKESSLLAQETVEAQPAAIPEAEADTLGSSVFQSTENKLIALQMLAECAAAISEETQAMRNYVVEAMYAGMPQTDRTVLVTNEMGDLHVVEIDAENVTEI